MLSTWTGIPVSTLTQDETRKLLHLEQALKQRVVGQEAGWPPWPGPFSAAAPVSRRRTGPWAPSSSCPSRGGQDGAEPGPGPGPLRQPRRPDPAGYVGVLRGPQRLPAHRLPPGYVGHGEGGQLTGRSGGSPYSVVLFDELEKANDQVWNLLLQILEDRALTRRPGQKADFRNAVLILTSTWGPRPGQATPWA